MSRWEFTERLADAGFTSLYSPRTDEESRRELDTGERELREYETGGQAELS